MDATVRLALAQRQKWNCLACGKPLRGRGEVHHRQRRRVGGHGLGNCVYLHRSCHQHAHANPLEARERGLIVSSYETDLTSVPVTIWDGRKFLLDDEGGATVQD